MNAIGKRRIIIYWLALLFLPILSHAAEINLNVKISANPVGVGQTFTYQVEVSGKRMNIPDLTKMPEFNGFKVLSGPNVSSSVSIVNFNTTSQKTFSWALYAKKVGKFNITAPQIRAGGKVYKGKSVTITVSNKPNPALNTRSQGTPSGGQKINLADHVFLRAEPGKTNVYEGEQIIIAYRLYFDYQISSPALESNDYKDFWVEEFDLGKELTLSRVNYKGKIYQVTTVKKMAVYPTRSGKVPLPQLALSLDVVLPSQRRRSRSLFDDFFDSPFGRRERITVSSNRLNLNVKSLPRKDRPAHFSGLVGDFALTGGLNKKTAKINEAVTYFLKLNGRGNLYLVAEPALNYSNEFEDYPGNLKKNINWSTGKSGTVSWEQVLIPRSAGELKIPAYSLNWFNPRSGKYQQKTIGPLQLSVAGDARRNYSSSGGVVNRQTVEALSKDIRYLKTDKHLYQRGENFWIDGRFFAILFLGLMFVAIAVILEQYQQKMAGDRSLQRQRKAGKQANKRFREARSYIHADNEKFFSELEKAILGFFSDRLDLPIANLNKGDVAAILNKKEIPEEYTVQLINVLKTAEIRRYAPGESDPGEREQLLENAVNALSVVIRRLKK